MLRPSQGPYIGSGARGFLCVCKYKQRGIAKCVAFPRWEWNWNWHQLVKRLRSVNGNHLLQPCIASAIFSHLCRCKPIPFCSSFSACLPVAPSAQTAQLSFTSSFFPFSAPTGNQNDEFLFTAHTNVFLSNFQWPIGLRKIKKQQKKNPLWI